MERRELVLLRKMAWIGSTKVRVIHAKKIEGHVFVRENHVGYDGNYGFEMNGLGLDSTF